VILIVPLVGHACPTACSKGSTVCNVTPPPKHAALTVPSSHVCVGVVLAFCRITNALNVTASGSLLIAAAPPPPAAAVISAGPLNVIA